MEDKSQKIDDLPVIANCQLDTFASFSFKVNNSVTHALITWPLFFRRGEQILA